ncbi:hypothetical protein TELCIR_05030 [Teladorsagia circumcincta]|uniref:Protein kinase domain-containing protein n=1 Tax=Teladorsagia circumcincta TaxID=45464 RepID=A0A2G9UU25_TELCI|nr:hypothetical protein TELCIR_05030 [Teladorsagia circumcincta]
MNSRFHRNEVNKECLSSQLLRWIRERIPVDDPIRIKSLSSYKEMQSLGKGRFGERLDMFIAEFRHLHRISLANDRIANFLGLFADEHQLLIFTEYLPNGSVKDKVMNNNINENTAIHYFIDVATQPLGVSAPILADCQTVPPGGPPLRRLYKVPTKRKGIS